MWKFSGKKDRKKNDSSKTRLGARKVALFLSVLEPSVADGFLSLFDSETASAIAEEAKAIGVVSPEDIEEAVSDFLDAVGRDALDPELAEALVAEARHNIGARASRLDDVLPEREQSSVSPLGVVAPERLSALLENERAATLAAIASKLSSLDKEALLETFSADARKLVSHFIAKARVTPSLKRLEDVLFERSYDD